MIADFLRHRIRSGEIDHVDAHFSQFMARLGETGDTRLLNLFAELSRALSQQHSCLNLAELDIEQEVIDALAGLRIVDDGNGGRETPLVLDGSRLYMQRYHAYETRVATWLSAMNEPLPSPPRELKQTLDVLFGPNPTQQKLAAYQAMTRKLSIVTGGPGTGKTSTVVRILEAELSRKTEVAPVIRLAAPTGKAAMRLAESLSDSTLTAAFEVQTLHRLLGMRAGGRSWRYGPHSPLTVDLLVIDEVSMIDLAMMHRLLAALPDHARLILLGDPDQLPSVEAGNILADICRFDAGYSAEFVANANDTVGLTLAPSDTPHALQDAICRLDVSYRFSPDKGIGKLSRSIRQGESIAFMEDTEVSIQPLTALSPRALFEIYADYFARLNEETDHLDLLDAFERARILAPMREGELGVTALNDIVSSQLGVENEPFYHGRPVLVTRNDYNLGLFNGDVGICINTEGMKEPLVIFRDSAGKQREYLASRLPEHQTCFAMTVHKAQGSEFNHVTLVLPAELPRQSGNLLTRELIYTAVTRARDRVDLFSEPAVLEMALSQRTRRHSGLGNRFLTTPPDAPPAGGVPPAASGGPLKQMDLFGEV